MVERGVQLVGIDFLSIEAFETPGRPTHRTLLGAGVIIVEGLDLSAAVPGTYTLVCLPLRLCGADGSPARAVLMPA
jgi:arylformamidase